MITTLRTLDGKIIRRNQDGRDPDEVQNHPGTDEGMDDFFRNSPARKAYMAIKYSIYQDWARITYSD